MDKTVYVKPTLYKIFKEAAEEGTYAKEYTGSHKDSFTEGGTQKIYHWYGSNDIDGTAILDKNNVIFAGHCWQMIRTTDTGGVKMIYNGEVENNQCLNTRGTHVGYSGRITQSMSTAYYYGTSYDYDSGTKSFTLAGTVTTGEIKTGQYTCAQTSIDDTCTTLYYVDTLSSETNYYVLPLNTNSYYSQFGTLQFNQQCDSLADVGYMYNTRYASEGQIKSSKGYLFGNGFTYNNKEYTLKDTIECDSTTDLSNNHYTCFNTTGKCTEISYIYYVNAIGAYYINIKDGKSVEDVKNETLYNDDVNTTNSTIKTGVDLWYEKYLLEYSDYLEDTIFCNDRSQNNSDTNGWNPNGGSLSTIMRFYGSVDLSCPNETDRFSTLNDKAKLKYKVGLMSYREMELLNNLEIDGIYWLGSPATFVDDGNGGSASMSFSYRGELLGGELRVPIGVRPAISLKPGTKYVDGDGSMASPYIVDTDS